MTVQNYLWESIEGNPFEKGFPSNSLPKTFNENSRIGSATLFGNFG